MRILYITLVSTMVIAGCNSIKPSNHQFNQQFNKAQSSLGSSIVPVTPKEPELIGWDESGHKKYDTDKSQKNLSVVSSKIKTSPILNEDAIICESDSALTIFDWNDLIGNQIHTGSLMVSVAKMEILSLEVAKSRFEFGANIRLTEYEEKAKKASVFLGACKLTQEPQAIEVIEIKPISKVAKIKVRIENNSYELWTFVNLLTNI